MHVLFIYFQLFFFFVFSIFILVSIFRKDNKYSVSSVSGTIILSSNSPRLRPHIFKYLYEICHKTFHREDALVTYKSSKIYLILKRNNKSETKLCGFAILYQIPHLTCRSNPLSLFATVHYHF